MKWIVDLVVAFYASAPAALASLSRVAGRTVGTPAMAGKWASESKVNAALTAVNMGAAGSLIVDWLMADDNPDQQALTILKRVVVAIDKLEPNAKLTLSDLAKYADELELIRRVANRVGGMERLMELRTVLMLPDQYFDLESVVRSITR
jgi:hypothetical protein